MIFYFSRLLIHHQILSYINLNVTALARRLLPFISLKFVFTLQRLRAIDKTDQGDCNVFTGDTVSQLNALLLISGTAINYLFIGRYPSDSLNTYKLHFW